MQFSTFIFIGRSGCGKGTQAKLLMERYPALNDGPKFYLETGAKFREFLENSGYSNELARKISGESGRQPDFLAVWMWAHIFLEKSADNEHWIIDGTPRSLPEAHVLHTAFEFYMRERPTVIYLDVSWEWSFARLEGRGRDDDRKSGDMKKRMEWFEKDVLPAVDWYRSHPGYSFIEVNGEQTVEEVHRDIMRLVAGR